MRVHFIGDSHGQVLGKRIAAAFPGATIVAHPGWSEARYLASGELTRLDGADLVVYQLGGNNFTLSAAAYKRTLERLVRAAGRAQVLWIGPSTATDAAVSARHEATAALQARLLPGMGVTWFDSRPVTRTGHRSDGVHFADYGPWANAIIEAIRTGRGTTRAYGPVGWYVVGALLVVVTAAAWRRR